MFRNLNRIIRTRDDRGVVSETVGTLLYELGDVGYGAIDWICKGILVDKNDTPYNRESWLNKDLDVDFLEN